MDVPESSPAPSESLWTQMDRLRQRQQELRSAGAFTEAEALSAELRELAAELRRVTDDPARRSAWAARAGAKPADRPVPHIPSVGEGSGGPG